jgi:hypothetical protein
MIDTGKKSIKVNEIPSLRIRSLQGSPSTRCKTNPKKLWLGIEFDILLAIISDLLFNLKNFLANY